MLDYEDRNPNQICISFDLMFIVKLFHIITNTFHHGAGSCHLVLSKIMNLFKQIRTVPVEDIKRCASWSAHFHNSTVIIRKKRKILKKGFEPGSQQYCS